LPVSFAASALISYQTIRAEIYEFVKTAYGLLKKKKYQRGKRFLIKGIFKERKRQQLKRD
jgi:hypothetical protein